MLMLGLFWLLGAALPVLLEAPGWLLTAGLLPESDVELLLELLLGTCWATHGLT